MLQKSIIRLNTSTPQLLNSLESQQIQCNKSTCLGVSQGMMMACEVVTTGGCDGLQLMIGE